jgi:glucose-6-phosphate-specific signal transduction histidine kinase
VFGRVPEAAPEESSILGAASARRAASDLGLVAVLTLAVWIAAGRLDMVERFLRVTGRLERWQADELIFALTAFALGLSWYALRRWREAQLAGVGHQRAEQRVGELLAHNRELAQQLIAVQDTERRALARELHDELGQCCTAIRAEASLIDRAADLPLARAAAARIDATAETLYGTVRQMLHRLRPVDLDALGLLAAIQALCERWETSSGVACVFHHDRAQADWAALDDASQVTIYRVVQEALSNVMRHAQADQVKIVLRQGEGHPPRVRLQIEDNGRGADLQAPRRGLGLLGATERAAALGGELQLHSAPGQGMRLQMWLPGSPAADAGAAGASR